MKLKNLLIGALVVALMGTITVSQAANSKGLIQGKITVDRTLEGKKFHLERNDKDSCPAKVRGYISHKSSNVYQIDPSKFEGAAGECTIVFREDYTKNTAICVFEYSYNTIGHPGGTGADVTLVQTTGIRTGAKYTCLPGSSIWDVTIVGPPVNNAKK